MKSSTTAPCASTRRDQQPVELVQAGGDARAALPVLHPRGGPGEGVVGIAVRQLAGDVGEPRREDEGVHAPALLGDGVQEVQEQARVLRHRARDVDERDERRVPHRCGVAEGEVDDGAAGAQRAAEGAARIDAPAVRGRRRKRRVGTLVVGQAQRRDQRASRSAISSADIWAKSFAFSTSRSDMVSRAENSVILARLPRLRACGAHRLGDAQRAGLRLRPRACAAGATGDICAISFSISAAAAPEDAEGLVEQTRVLVPLHEDRVQRPVEILARADARRLDGLDRIEHRARADRQAGGPQRAGEIGDVLGEAAARSPRGEGSEARAERGAPA